MTAANDNRIALRIRTAVRVCFNDGLRRRQATTSNISSTGFRIACDAPLARGSEVRGSIMTRAGSVPFRALVMWSQRPARGDTKHTIGLRLLEAAPSYDELVGES